MKTLLEGVCACALVAGIFLNWGVGWALIGGGMLGLVGLFLAGTVE